MTDFNAACSKLATLMTMAGQVDPGEEGSGLFWCDGPGADPDHPQEPPFPTMVCTATLLRSIAAHGDLVAEINRLAGASR